MDIGECHRQAVTVRGIDAGNLGRGEPVKVSLGGARTREEDQICLDTREGVF